MGFHPTNRFSNKSETPITFRRISIKFYDYDYDYDYELNETNLHFHI